MIVDLNADLGEGAGIDAELLAIVTSANVACGFHAGDPETMRAACAAAAERGVIVGAHVAYRDREGFGRRARDVSAERIGAEAAEQIAALAAAAGGGARVRYVKPHGALYHRCSVDADAARAVVDAAARAGLGAALGLPGSALLACAQAAGLDAVAEGFVDRRYASALELVPRDEPGAMLSGDAAAGQALALARGDAVALGGEALPVVRSLCVHGDAPRALETARAVREALEAAGAGPAPFA